MKVRSEQELCVDSELVDPTTTSDWDHQVLGHHKANVFHSAAWARVLMKTYNHRPTYLRCYQGNHLIALVPLMELQSLFRPRRGISLPFSDYCDPLFFEPASEGLVLRELCRVSTARNWKYLELRGSGCVPPDGVPAVSFYSHQISLKDGFLGAASSFHPSVGRALRKARRSDQLSVEIDDSESAMRTFFPLLALTRRRHGLPPQPLAFFLHIQREILAKKMGFIVLVRLLGKPIAAMVFFHWGRTALYKFGASDKHFQEHRPNNLAMAAAIQRLTEVGSETLHFGRSSLSNAGLRRFKLTWGATEGALHYYRYSMGTAQWETTLDRTEGVYTKIFKHMPLAFNRVAGRLIYPHLD